MSNKIIETGSGGDTDTREFRWRSRPTSYARLVQVTDNYVVHARGFTVGRDVWLDEYAVHGGHKQWWGTHLAQRYHGKDWENPDDFPQRPLYWSVTGSGTFIMQYPTIDEADAETVHRLGHFCRWFDVPAYITLLWNVDDENYVTCKFKDLYRLIDGIPTDDA